MTRLHYLLHVGQYTEIKTMVPHLQSNVLYMTNVLTAMKTLSVMMKMVEHEHKDRGNHDDRYEFLRAAGGDSEEHSCGIDDGVAPGAADNAGHCSVKSW